MSEGNSLASFEMLSVEVKTAAGFKRSLGKNKKLLSVRNSRSSKGPSYRELIGRAQRWDSNR